MPSKKNHTGEVVAATNERVVWPNKGVREQLTTSNVKEYKKPSMEDLIDAALSFDKMPVEKQTYHIPGSYYLSLIKNCSSVKELEDINSSLKDATMICNSEVAEAISKQLILIKGE